MVRAAVLASVVGVLAVQPPAASAAEQPPEGFQGLTPVRVLDTRAGASTIDGQALGSGPLSGGATLELPVAGRGGVPASGVAAVALNVTAADAARVGYITAYPTGSARPEASNLNFVAGKAAPNTVIVPVGTGGRVSLYNGSTGGVQLLADVLGWFPTGGSYHGLNPARLMDTRPGTQTVDGPAGGGPLPGDWHPASIPLVGRGGVPSTGVAAVAVNITVTNPLASGYLTAFPSGAVRPTASTLNFEAGQTVPNLAIVPVGELGQLSVFNGSTGSVHLIVDVLGWFSTDPGFVGQNPVRLLDTRAGTITGDGAYAGSGPLDTVPVNLRVGGRGGVPASGVGSVVLNVTVTQPNTTGYLSVYPLGQPQPTASSLNFVAGQTVANLVIVPLGSDGQIKLARVGEGPVPDDDYPWAHVIVDVLGWFPGEPVAGELPTPVLRSNGLSDVPFGVQAPFAMMALEPFVDGTVSVQDQTYPVTVSPGVYQDAEGFTQFAYPVSRQVCSMDNCLVFGGTSTADLAFVGWSTFDGRYLDPNGVGVGARVDDVPAGIASVGPIFCGGNGSGVTTSGIDFVYAEGNGDVVSPFAGPEYEDQLTIVGMSAGTFPVFLQPGC